MDRRNSITLAGSNENRITDNFHEDHKQKVEDEAVLSHTKEYTTEEFIVCERYSSFDSPRLDKSMSREINLHYRYNIGYVTAKGRTDVQLASNYAIPSTCFGYTQFTVPILNFLNPL